MSKKYKINLSYYTYSTLINDMNAFRFYKSNGTINKNLFINLLVFNYHEKINYSIDSYINNVTKIFKNYKLLSKDISNIVERIIDLNKTTDEESKNNYELTFVSTSKYESAFVDIEDNYLKHYNFSEYLRKLLNSYSKLHQDDREKIIFTNEIRIFEHAIKEKKKIIFEENTIKMSYTPVAILNSKDRQFTYALLYNNHQFFVLHLFKLINLRISKEFAEDFSVDLNKYKEILGQDIQFSSSKLINVAVKFSKNGQKMFTNIFINRPVPYKKENDIYYFNAPVFQLFSYLLRFGKEITIMNNKELNDMLQTFHKKAYLHLKENSSFD